MWIQKTPSELKCSVNNEMQHLDSLITKLERYFDCLKNGVADSIPSEEHKKLLAKQYKHMLSYRATLKERCDLFTKEIEAWNEEMKKPLPEKKLKSMLDKAIEESQYEDIEYALKWVIEYHKDKRVRSYAKKQYKVYELAHYEYELKKQKEKIKQLKKQIKQVKKTKKVKK